MNVEEKAKQQKVIDGMIRGMEFSIQQAVLKKDGFRAKLQNLQMNGTKDYSPEYVDRELQKIQADLYSTMQTVNAGVAKSLDDLRGLIKERDAELDLTNPALSMALSIIPTLNAFENIQGDQGFNEAEKINQNFVHDQSALRVLRTSYDSHGIKFTGNIDGMIYDVDSVFDNLKKLAFYGLAQDGSINAFASAFAKFAAIENVAVFDSIPDEAGAKDALRKAAGL